MDNANVGRGIPDAPPAGRGDPDAPPAGRVDSDAPQTIPADAMHPSAGRGDPGTPPVGRGDPDAPPVGRGDPDAPSAGRGDPDAPSVERGDPDAPQTNTTDAMHPSAGRGDPYAPQTITADAGHSPVGRGDPDAPPPEPPVILEALPGDVYSFAAELDGIVYSLPVPYAALQENGWRPASADADTRQVESGQFELVAMRNGAHSVYMGLVNNGDKDAPLSECHAGIIYFDESDAKSGTRFLLPGGVTVGASYDDIVALYGVESARLSYDWSVNIHYKERDSRLELELDAETMRVININYRNLARRERLPAYAGKPPAALDAYTAPEALGNDWRSLTCLYGGALYKLPVPAPELVKNGWVFLTDENGMLGPREQSGELIELRKDNQVLYTYMRNYSDTAQPLKYCHVTELSYDKHNTKIHLELPGGVSEKSSADEIYEKYGTPDYIDKDSFMYDNFSYGADGYGINISISVESAQVVWISIFSSPAALT